MPSYGDIAQASRGVVSYEELLSMEPEILKLLNFQFHLRTPYHFLYTLLATGVVFKDDQKANPMSAVTQITAKKVEHYAWYVHGHALYYQEIVASYPPSKVAVACLYIARQACRLKPWTPTLEELTQIKEKQLRPVLRAFDRSLGPYLNFMFNKQEVPRPPLATISTEGHSKFQAFLDSKGIKDPYKDCARKEVKQQ